MRHDFINTLLFGVLSGEKYSEHTQWVDRTFLAEMTCVIVLNSFQVAREYFFDTLNTQFCILKSKSFILCYMGARDFSFRKLFEDTFEAFDVNDAKRLQMVVLCSF